MRRRAFHIMAKPIGPLCNLDCSYCFYLEKATLYGQRDRMRRTWAMRPEVLESYVQQYIEAQVGSPVTFAWQGGEPTLLGLDFFRRAVALQAKHAGGKKIENTFQTNGVLIDDAWAELFAENQFLVGLSIDGPEEIHDRYRVDRGGAGTFARVVRALEVLRRHGVSFNTLTAVHRLNAEQPLPVYRFLKEVGSEHLQFIPIVERAADASVDEHALVSPSHSGEASVTPWSVQPEAYGEFLCAVFDEWVRHDVGRIFVQLFDVALRAWAGLPSGLCRFDETCGAAVALEHNGDLYSCDHFVYPEYRLGNIMDEALADLTGSDRQRAFGDAKRDALPSCCRECDVLFACNGGCPKHRFVATPDGHALLDYLCPAHQRFFRHADPHLRFMVNEIAEGRAPANVMAWAGWQDFHASGRKQPGRNDRCPCGSGKKYKRCCGNE